jgi:hypothetical protein
MITFGSAGRAPGSKNKITYGSKSACTDGRQLAPFMPFEAFTHLTKEACIF